jgi:hypothetical protein
VIWVPFLSGSCLVDVTTHCLCWLAASGCQPPQVGNHSNHRLEWLPTHSVGKSWLATHLPVSCQPVSQSVGCLLRYWVPSAFRSVMASPVPHAVLAGLLFKGSKPLFTQNLSSVLLELTAIWPQNGTSWDLLKERRVCRRCLFDEQTWARVA